MRWGGVGFFVGWGGGEGERGWEGGMGRGEVRYLLAG